MWFYKLARQIHARFLLRGYEFSAVKPGEHVLRLMHKHNYKADNPNPVQRIGLRPHKNDTDGLSLYRADFTSPRIVDRAGRKPGEYYIARISVRDIEAIEAQNGFLSVTPQPNPDPGHPRGHSVIAELCSTSAAENWSKDAQLKLAQLASDGIVWRPSEQRRIARMNAWLRGIVTAIRFRL